MNVEISYKNSEGNIVYLGDEVIRKDGKLYIPKAIADCCVSKGALSLHEIKVTNLRLNDVYAKLAVKLGWYKLNGEPNLMDVVDFLGRMDCLGEVVSEQIFVRAASEVIREAHFHADIYEQNKAYYISSITYDINEVTPKVFNKDEFERIGWFYTKEEAQMVKTLLMHINEQKSCKCNTCRG